MEQGNYISLNYSYIEFTGDDKAVAQIIDDFSKGKKRLK